MHMSQITLGVLGYVQQLLSDVLESDLSNIIFELNVLSAPYFSLFLPLICRYFVLDSVVTLI